MVRRCSKSRDAIVRSAADRDSSPAVSCQRVDLPAGIHDPASQLVGVSADRHCSIQPLTLFV
jgi:hypothetical protein